MRRNTRTLRVYHPDLDPDALSAKLGLSPTDAQKKGQARHGVPAKMGGWFLSSAAIVHSRDCRRHIDWLLEQLSGKERILKQLRSEGYRMDISCFWASAYGHGGPVLSPQSMQKLAQLELEIGFDVYFWGEDQGDEQTSEPQSSKRPGGQSSG